MEQLKNQYSTPASEVVVLIANKAILQISNTEGIGGGVDD